MHKREYELDPEKLLLAIKAAGFRGVTDVARRIGVHRNTLNHFLSGSSVFPDSLNRLFAMLDADPRQFLKQRESGGYDLKLISSLIDRLSGTLPKACFVLFGSRARRNHKRFSDFDIGVFSNEGISHHQFLELLEIKEKLAEDLPVCVDLVNLNRADDIFLKNIKTDMLFISGRLSDWLSLQKLLKDE